MIHPQQKNIGISYTVGLHFVDDFYGAALLEEFADAAARDVYQGHFNHLRIIAKCSQYWSRVQVYDTVLVAG